jgi:hypothetical protein
MAKFGSITMPKRSD